MSSSTTRSSRWCPTCSPPTASPRDRLPPADTDEASLLAFTHYLRRPEPHLDLGRAALLLAEAYQPGLDVAFHAGRIERLGDEARRRIAGTPDEATEVRARRLLRLLYEEVGFSGNRADYYDPRNSLLNEVLDRRLGIPISLAVIVMEVARHAGMEAEGVGFPGHFLVRLPTPSDPSETAALPGLLPGVLFSGVLSDVLIDPYAGRVLTRESLRALHAQVTGDDGDPDAKLLAATGKRQILARMLSNLRSIYRSRGDQPALRTTLQRLAVLTPGDEEVAAALAALAPAVPLAPPKLKN